MKTAKLFTGSICLSDLIDAAKRGHSAFSKSAKNGKVYCNILIWENEEPDKYEQTHALQLNSAKDKQEAEGKIYIGNATPVTPKSPTGSDLPSGGWDDNIPVREKSANTNGGTDIAADPVSDLPF